MSCRPCADEWPVRGNWHASWIWAAPQPIEHTWPCFPRLLISHLRPGCASWLLRVADCRSAARLCRLYIFIASLIFQGPYLTPLDYGAHWPAVGMQQPSKPPLRPRYRGFSFLLCKASVRIYSLVQVPLAHVPSSLVTYTLLIPLHSFSGHSLAI